MKSTVNKVKKEDELKFPCLMVGKNTGTIYLMTSKAEGVHISGRNIGKKMIISNLDNLDPFHGSVVLEND